MWAMSMESKRPSGLVDLYRSQQTKENVCVDKPVQMGHGRGQEMSVWTSKSV